MESASAIAISLALGAEMIARSETIAPTIKDAYVTLRELIRTRYPDAPVADPEQNPRSQGHRLLVTEKLEASGAAGDPEVLAAARKLMETIQEYAPGGAQNIGLDLGDILAASVRLSDATGSGTGVRVRDVRIMGDISISGIVAQSDYKPPRSS
jgi:hypothetical protein